MAGKTQGAQASQGSQGLTNVAGPQKMGQRIVRAYAEGRLAAAGNHPSASEPSGSPAYIAFAYGVTNTANASYKTETAV